MRSAKHLLPIFICTLLCLSAVSAQALQQRPQAAAESDVTIVIQPDKVRFTAQQPVAEMQLQVFNQVGELVFDSGALETTEVNWPLQAISGEALKSGLYAYTLSIKEVGKEAGAEARLRRGHFIVDRAKDRDGADKLWVTSQNESSIGTELTVAKDQAATVAGAAISGERTAGNDRAGLTRDGGGREIETATQSKTDVSKAASPSATTGTVGQIAKFTSANGVGDSVMTELNGNIGIGTANPIAGYRLDINGGMHLTAAPNSSNNGEMYFGTPSTEVGMSIFRDLKRADIRFDGSSLKLVARGLEGSGPPSNESGLVINTLGSVGIGTANPRAGYKLHVDGNTLFNIGNGGEITFGAPNSETGLSIIRAGGRADLRFEGSTMKLVAGPAGGPPGSENGIAVTTSGNVGIGTVTPAAKLHVMGDYLRVDGKGNEQVYIGGDGVGNDAQLGSSNPGVTDVVLWNRATNKHMKLVTSSLTITSGADFAENFEVNAAPENGQARMPEITAGMVVSIDPAHPGKLKLSAQAYDRRVAGIISGAGGVQPGMTMGQEKTLADGKHPVALSGRVYVWADARPGAIRPGDMLTTSATPGHAMKVAGPAKAQGAIIGKAMTGLKGGKGLVLVLVTLQ